MFNTASKHFCKRLHIRLPIIQAPMAGRIISPRFIREVAEAGGLGSLPLGYLSLAQAQTLMQKTTAETPLPFAVNVFAPSYPAHAHTQPTDKMLTHINHYRERMGLPDLISLPSLS